MVGVEFLLQRLAVALHLVGVGVELRQRDSCPVRVDIEVDVGAGEAVDVEHALEAEVPEHHVERAVLHHQHDDVLDLLELVESVVVRHERTL